MSVFIISTPESYLPERSYILDVVIKQWLGFEYKHQIWLESYSQIRVNDYEESALAMPDTFFQTPAKDWLTERSLPLGPLPLMDLDHYREEIPLTNSDMPIISGRDHPEGVFSQYPWQHRQPYLWNAENNCYLGIDIFGAAFFMLTRYEEYVEPDRDQFGRFPASASLACREGFLERPIINEYIEVLWWCMKRLWPGLERKKRAFQTMVSHDVDIPFAYAITSTGQLIHNLGGDLLKRKSPLMAINRARSWVTVKRSAPQQDPYYNFGRLMDISEQHNLRSAFYFKTGCTNPNYDDKYSINHPYLRALLRDIHNRGHEIGLHPSYETYLNPEQTRAEFHRLLHACAEEDIRQEEWGGRQHFLRWQVPITWRSWAEAGLDYDSTLGYADHAGFRCGVCYEFPVYDLELSQPLALVERPLIVMEASVLGEQYMNLNEQQALDSIMTWKQMCNMYKGVFTLLWHNSSFDSPEKWEMYTAIAAP